MVQFLAMTVKKVSKPNIYEYLDAASFLKDYYTYRKSLDSNFSYDKWSKELNLTSRSFVRLIVTGQKKISPNFIEAFSVQCFHVKDEAIYFRHLCQYSQARDQRDRDLHGRELLRLIKSQNTQTPLELTNDFISDPLLPRVLTILAFDDLPATGNLVAQLMGKSLEEIEKALSVLHKLNLVYSEKVGNEVFWKTTNKNFKVGSDKGNKALMQFHEKCLMDAIKAFDQPKPERRYDSIILPLSPEEVENFNSALDEFISEQIARFSNKSYGSRRLFQINVNSHAVTRNYAVPKSL